MPWTPRDADRFKKGLTPAQRKKWAAVANGTLKSTGNDGEAVRTANKAVGKARTKR